MIGVWSMSIWIMIIFLVPFILLQFFSDGIQL